jgi:alpha-D-ribose 1-methylphosphonate 5-triphosphate diphosphatase
MQAAVAAKERGMTVVCGAPNVLRGGSHCGNASAQELIAADVCDVLASDYMPSTLLGAVAGLVDRGVCGLAKAFDLVTGGPAASVGLRDRGRLAIGMRADLTLVSFNARLSTVRGVWSAEEVRS